jgi:hypothetical protein
MIQQIETHDPTPVSKIKVPNHPLCKIYPGRDTSIHIWKLGLNDGKR